MVGELRRRHLFAALEFRSANFSIQIASVILEALLAV